MLPPEYIEFGTLDCELPDYNAIVVPTSSNTSSRFAMSIHLASPKCTLGSFVSGKLQFTPKKTISPDCFIISIVNRERAGRYGSVAPKVLHRAIAVSVLSNTATLVEGNGYNIDFSIKIPEYGWLNTCKCGSKSPHAILPPSFGRHSFNVPVKCCCDYLLVVICGGYYAQEYLEFQMNTPVNPLDQVSKQWVSLSNSITRLFRHPSHILIQIDPLVYFTTLAKSPMALVYLFFAPNAHNDKPPTISRIDYKVIRRTLWWRDRLSSPNVHKQVIYSGYSPVVCNWVKNKTTIKFPIDLMVSHCLEPSYDGCLTSMNYSVEVYFAGIKATQILTVGTSPN